jgi:hypothetical protein
MKNRCQNANHPSYTKYGAQGVRVCERWQSYENFYADMGERPEGKTIDRINPFGNYEPSNCRWANAFEQAQNKKHNTKFMDVKLTMT